MRRMLPSVVELSVLATLAVIAAVFFLTTGSEAVLPIIAFPLLITSMLMGARRTGHLAPVREHTPEVTRIKQSA